MNQADRDIEAMTNVIYAALGKQITFKSAVKVFEERKRRI